MNNEWNAKAPIVPFSENGSKMLEYGGYCDNWVAVDPEFGAEMELVRTERGRSAVRFIVRDVWTNIEYPTFLTDMEYLINNATIHKGNLGFHTWRFVKRGQNYGIALANKS